jgi:beta-aspartyl-peptidase (threonine type)
VKMLIIASSNGKVGIKAAMQVLKEGGSAIDAVETGVRLVEANPEEHSVGYGGYPNILGQVELDAGIMDGCTLATGAVGAVQGYKYPISIARRVMECLTHVFLVGEGAARFAAEMGFERCNLLTEPAREVWASRLQEDMADLLVGQANSLSDTEEAVSLSDTEAAVSLSDTEQSKRLSQALSAQPDLWRWVKIATDPERAKGTVNFIARDAQGHIGVGVSTSGWAWKYPGRLGDSPVIGAGLYADDRYGAAACTGMGEMAIRAGTAHSIVLYMKMGLALEEAGRRAMQDLNDLGGHYLSRLSFITMDCTGQHAGFSNAEEETYIYMTSEMNEPQEASRVYVQTKTRWER